MNRSRVVAIVSHDAGGAEILANYVYQNKIACRFVLAGPAVSIFERRLGAIEICSLEDGLLACDKVLCGTSWQSDLEWLAIERGRQLGKKVSAFLDHWINYQERFIRNGIQQLPDTIWVGDADAERLAREKFPNILIRLVPNPYFIDLRRKLSEIGVEMDPGKNNGTRVLFVSENISDHALMRYGNERYWGYTEFDAIKYFLAHMNALDVNIEKVVIRPHPSDSLGKYVSFLSEDPCVKLSGGGPLLQEIVNTDIVVGCQSMAMVVGLLARKKVVSCIPPFGPECSLPQKQIIQFRELVSDGVTNLGATPVS